MKSQQGKVEYRQRIAISNWNTKVEIQKEYSRDLPQRFEKSMLYTS